MRVLEAIDIGLYEMDPHVGNPRTNAAVNIQNYRMELRKQCPRCNENMQKSGQKANSNGVIKQRFLCTECKRCGRSPYNFFYELPASHIN